MVGKIPPLTLRVYYEDTDAEGVVYYARYLAFTERARGEWFRAIFKPDGTRLWTPETPLFVVRHLEVDYEAPARLDDVLTVQTDLVHVGGASLRIRHTIARDGTVLTRMTAAIVCVDRQGKVLRIPPDWRQTLLPHIQEGA